MNIKLNPELLQRPAMVVDAQEFRAAMAQLAAAVHVITTDGVAGRAGFTASAVCSVSDSPASLLVCLNRSASVFNAFSSNQVLCVNTLASQHQHLSNLFGGKTAMDERFAQAQWTQLHTGAPVLADALLAFDCVISEVVSFATHDVLLCNVQAIHQTKNQDNALIYFNRGYCEPTAMH